MNIVEYESYHEQKSHFSENFAYNTYLCSIPLDFVEVPMHWHYEAEFIYIKKGAGIINVDFEQYQVESGDVVFVAPGCIHSISQRGGDSMEYENIIFDSRLLLSCHGDDSYEKSVAAIFERRLNMPVVFKAKGEIEDENGCKINGTGYRVVKNCLDNNDLICSKFPQGYEVGVKGNLMILCFELLQLFEISAPGTKRGNPKAEKLKSVIKHVELNYARPIPVSEVASLSGFSESHFMRFFKETMGVSFVTYLNDYRLTMAARLLLQSEDTVLYIAEQVGFENLSHFNRCFLKKYGVSPRVYRR